MMKYLISFILPFLSFTAIGQKADCTKFKNGKFKNVDSTRGSYIIVRSGSKQVEYDKETKLKVELTVEWLDDCTYTLKFKRIIENPNNIIISKNMILTVEIIKTNEKSYLQRTSSNLSDMVLKTEVLKIE